MNSLPLCSLGLLVVAALFAVAGCDDSGNDPTSGNPPPSSGVVSYSGFVNPTFQIYGCTTCHGGSGGLTLTSHQALMAGGNSGPAVIPGNGAGSLLIRKLFGTAPGSRMPQGGTPLPDSTINTISLWIDQGALNN